MGLFVLRLAVALHVFDSQPALDPWVHPALTLSAIILCVAVLIGLFTPVASIALAGTQFAAYATLVLTSDPLRTIYLLHSAETALVCIALALLGPGAYAWDATLFGRREIMIPKDRRRF